MSFQLKGNYTVTFLVPYTGAVFSAGFGLLYRFGGSRLQDFRACVCVCAPTLNLSFKVDNMMLNIDFIILVQNIDSIDPQIVVDDSFFLLASYQKAPLFKGSDSNKAPSVSDERIRHVYIH